jgi:transcriptional regulator with XRE-family HTH domain
LAAALLVTCCATGDTSGVGRLDLSLETGISQRHLSFVESGRSGPSRDFLAVVSDALKIPLRERNALLLAAGYAPQYSEQRMDAEQMAIVTRAIDRMLRRLLEYPGVAALKPLPAPQSPVLPLTFRRGNQRFSYFSLITTVGTPQCITAQELRA